MKLIEEFLSFKLESKVLKKESIEIYKIDIIDFKTYIGKELEIVEKLDIMNYIEELKKIYRLNSIKRKINSLRNFYKYLVKKRVIDSSPLEEIILEKSEEAIVEQLEEWEINAIIQNCENDYLGFRDRLMIQLIIDTKLSINEILKIKISDLKLSDYKSFFNEDKTERMVINEKLMLVLREYLKLREKERIESDYLFYGLSRQNFRARFMKLGKKAQLKRDITPNMLITKIKEDIKKENSNSREFYLKLRRKYMEIGIGDD